METRLANQLLRELLQWDSETESQYADILRTLSEWKWDSYEGFRAGGRFMESLARWLSQFPDKNTRMRWVDFVARHLVFVSSAELDHAIDTVYYDIIRPGVIDRVAVACNIPRFRTSQIANSLAFRTEQRRLLVLGLSDGARLDTLRRSCSGISHEQFFPSVEISEQKARDLKVKLKDALKQFESDEAPTFSHVLLIDDFYGSGTSLIDRSSEGKVKGKAARFLETAGKLAEWGVLADTYKLTVVLYIASSRAEEHIQHTLERLELSPRWTLKIVQRIPEGAAVTDPQLLADCDNFWDPVLEDDHKKAAARGYKDCALPIVLYHNSPNNSVCPLWADSTGRRRGGVLGENRRALFPRYERHHSDRP